MKVARRKVWPLRDTNQGCFLTSWELWQSRFRFINPEIAEPSLHPNGRKLGQAQVSNINGSEQIEGLQRIVKERDADIKKLRESLDGMEEDLQDTEHQLSRTKKALQEAKDAAAETEADYEVELQELHAKNKRLEEENKRLRPGQPQPINHSAVPPLVRPPATCLSLPSGCGCAVGGGSAINGMIRRSDTVAKLSRGTCVCLWTSIEHCTID